MPKTNLTYWEPKIARNKKRDKVVNTYYRQKGWTVIRIWEHGLKKEQSLAKYIKNLKSLQLLLDQLE